MTNDDIDKLHGEGSRSAALAQLLARAAARPGDPVLRAQVAIATEPDRAHEALNQAIAVARTCLELGVVDLAHEAATLLSQHFAYHPDVGVLMADVVLQRSAGQAIDEARRLLESIVAEHPDAVDARLRIAALSLGLGEIDAARRWIEPVYGTTAETRGLYVQALLAGGAIDEAADVAAAGIQGASAAAPSGLLYQLLGIAELSRGRVDAAIAALSEALRLGPEGPVAYYNLALAFEASGSRLAGLGVCDAGLDLAPEDERLLALRERLALRP